MPEIRAPKLDFEAKAQKDAFLAMNFDMKITSAKESENLLTNRNRSLDAATPLRLKMSSCKRI